MEEKSSRQIHTIEPAKKGERKKNSIHFLAAITASLSPAEFLAANNIFPVKRIVFSRASNNKIGIRNKKKKRRGIHLHLVGFGLYVWTQK